MGGGAKCCRGWGAAAGDRTWMFDDDDAKGRKTNAPVALFRFLSFSRAREAKLRSRSPPTLKSEKLLFSTHQRRKEQDEGVRDLHRGVVFYVYFC